VSYRMTSNEKQMIIEARLADERTTIEVRLADLHEHGSVLEACQATPVGHAEWQLPTFTRASQNVATVAVLLDTLPAPSTDQVGTVYQQLKNILGTTTTQHVESSLQHRVKALTSPPAHPKDGGQRATQGALEAGMASSPVRISAYDELSWPGTWSEPQKYRWHCLGDDNAQSWGL
jgi:hypothetical protein